MSYFLSSFAEGGRQDWQYFASEMELRKPDTSVVKMRLRQEKVGKEDTTRTDLLGTAAVIAIDHIRVGTN